MSSMFLFSWEAGLACEGCFQVLLGTLHGRVEAGR